VLLSPNTTPSLDALRLPQGLSWANSGRSRLPLLARVRPRAGLRRLSGEMDYCEAHGSPVRQDIPERARSVRFCRGARHLARALYTSALLVSQGGATM
jgi:hypothetical protein